MDLKPIFRLNNIDFSPMLKEVASYNVAYQKREGGNGGMMKDGSMTVDILAWKAVIKLKTKGVEASWLPLLLNELVADYVDVTFLDPRTNEARTATFIPDVVEAPVAYFADGVVKWYNSTSITLTER